MRGLESFGGGGAGAKKLKREREKKTQAPRLHASSRPRITRGENSKDEGPCIFAGGEGENSTAPRLRSSAFAFLARGGKGKKEMRGLGSLRGEKEKDLQQPGFARLPLLLLTEGEWVKKR